MIEKNSKGKSPEDYGFKMHQKEDFMISLYPASKVNKTIGVFSGKGGVGKSFISAALACGMQKKGYQVAMLDGDITGPSQGKVFGIHEKVRGQKGLMFPVVTKSGIQLMSTNMLLDMDVQPVIWRGPMVATVLKQFYSETLWQDVDYMFIDLPPGTSDVPLTLFQSVKLDGIIIVTSPQDLVAMVVEKAINMARMLNVKVLGLVENMAYITCPCCKEKIRLFGSSHAKEVATKYHLPLLAEMGMNPDIAKACDAGEIEKLHFDEFDSLLNYLESL